MARHRYPLVSPRQWRSRAAWTIAVLLVLGFAGELWAHAHLERSAPAGGSTIESPPTELRLWFSETPQLAFTHISLVGSDSSAVALGTTRAGGERSVIVPIVGTMAAGKYSVHWQTGGADGHPSRGTFAFSVTHGAPVAVGAPDAAGAPLGAGTDGGVVAAADTGTRGTRGSNAPVVMTPATPMLSSPRAYAAARWVEFTALLALLGCLTMRLTILPRLARSGVAVAAAQDGVLRLARATGVLLVIVAVVRLDAELRTMHGAQAYDGGTVRATLFETSWGQGWVTGIVAVLVALVALGFARRSAAAWAVAAVAGAVAAFAPGMTGHAVASAGVGGVLIDGVHVLGAGIWIGTLIAMVVVCLPALRAGDTPGGGMRVASLVRAFTPVALTGAGVVVVAGLLSAWLRLGGIAPLWETVYGRVLLVKLALVAGVLGIGAWNWKRVSPSLGTDDSPGRIRRTASFELVVGLLILAVTAVLVGTSPPVSEGDIGAGSAPAVSGK